ncbi:kinase-like domain-containing protein [Rhizophagus irregularis DAOM 181602=DAOM 197198]|nr:kinase-like domain-containing protein [Rhizophagus irregularis DAOM 181602=DAOM 197198]
MEGFKLSDDVFELIKDFTYWNLTDEQELLIDKLILNEELKERYKKNGLCKESIWKDGYMEMWDSGNNKWMRSKWSSEKDYENFPVALKCLHNSQDITAEFLREIELHIVTSSFGVYVNRCYGITKDPESNNFMMVMEYAKNGSLRQILDNSFNSMYWNGKLDILQRIANGLKDIHSQGLIHHDFHCETSYDSDDGHEIQQQVEEAERINEKFTSTSLPYNEPKNAIDSKDNDSFEYSESIEAIDFTNST